MRLLQNSPCIADSVFMHPTLLLTQELIARPSVTPEDAGCQQQLIERLEPLGFVCEQHQHGSVSNLWARLGSTGPLLVFAGHTDVVPPGPLDQWHSPPFVPSIREGKLYGRGAADMKTSIAAFVVAAEQAIESKKPLNGSIALLLTSDEEGPSIDGTARVVATLQARGETPDFCIVGEPTCTAQFGDTIKNGRRGSLSGKLTIRGVQGHVAYPHLAKNPIHLLTPALAELINTVWDTRSNPYFPPTTWQISNIHGGTGVGNVIPADLTLDFNFRFSTESTPQGLQDRIDELLNRYGLEYSLDWNLSGMPFLTPKGVLSEVLTKAIYDQTGVTAELSTTGGTSDGRFIAQICPQVIEFGPPNASIHKIDEHVELACIEPLTNIYRKTILELLTP